MVSPKVCSVGSPAVTAQHLQVIFVTDDGLMTTVKVVAVRNPLLLSSKPVRSLLLVTGHKPYTNFGLWGTMLLGLKVFQTGICVRGWSNFYSLASQKEGLKKHFNFQCASGKYAQWKGRFIKVREASGCRQINSLFWRSWLPLCICDSGEILTG